MPYKTRADDTRQNQTTQVLTAHFMAETLIFSYAHSTPLPTSLPSDQL